MRGDGDRCVVDSKTMIGQRKCTSMDCDITELIIRNMCSVMQKSTFRAHIHSKCQISTQWMVESELQMMCISKHVNVHHAETVQHVEL